MPSERDYYPQIQRMFADQGYETVADEFGLVPYDAGESRRVDVFAYRWDGDQTQVAAVECKDILPPRGITVALPQAIDMMLFVGNTYIATPTGSGLKAPENLNILNRLGIGYIALEGDCPRIVTTPDPDRLAIREEDMYVTQVRSRAKFLLAFREAAAGGPVKFGGLQHYLDTWASTSISGEVQLNAWVDAEWFSSGLNLEHKPTAHQILGTFDDQKAQALAGVLRSLPDAYEIHLHRKRKVPPTFEQDRYVKRANAMTTGNVKELVSGARTILAEPQWRPQISISKHVWPLIEDIRRQEAIKQLATVRRDITPVVGCLLGGEH